MRGALWRVILAALLATALAACGEAPPPRPTPEGLMGARASLESPAGEVVQIVVTDIPPGRKVEQVFLIDPEGRRHAAEGLIPATRESGTAGPQATIGIGVTGGTSSGIKPSLSLGLGRLGGAGAGRRSRRVLARVPLPDPAAFRTGAVRWRIEVTYLDVTGARRSLILPAAGTAR